MTLHWYQSEAIDNPTVWMADEGKYSLSVYRNSRGWAFKIWKTDNNGDAVLQTRETNIASQDVAMQTASEWLDAQTIEVQE